MPNPLLLLALSLSPLVCHSQGQAAPSRHVQVLIVGTFHMDNPGRDMLNPSVKEVLGSRRQQEIQDVVSRLQRFRPTKIAVEAPYGSTRVQERFSNYLAGNYTLTPNEIDQIGMRLAQNLGQSRLYGIDYRQDLDIPGVLDYAQKNGQAAYAEEMMRTVKEKVLPKLNSDYMERHTIREILMEANTPETDAIGHSIYMAALRIGKDDQYVGADMVAAWYARNLKIAANIARIADSPDERILVLIGAGHGKLLREYLRQMPGMEVVDANRFLK